MNGQIKKICREVSASLNSSSQKELRDMLRDFIKLTADIEFYLDVKNQEGQVPKGSVEWKTNKKT